MRGPLDSFSPVAIWDKRPYLSRKDPRRLISWRGTSNLLVAFAVSSVSLMSANSYSFKKPRVVTGSVTSVTTGRVHMWIAIHLERAVLC